MSNETQKRKKSKQNNKTVIFDYDGTLHRKSLEKR